MAQSNLELGGKDLLVKVGNGLGGNAVTFTDTGDLVTITAHGLAVGDIVRFSAVVTTTTVVANTTYYVVGSVTANTFQISATEGGSALNIDADGTGTSEEAFKTIGGSRSATLSFAAAEIDITNQDSSQWRTLLDQAGIRSVDLSIDGVFKDDASAARVRSYFLNQQIKNWRVCINPDGDYWQGCFKVTSLENTGSYDAQQDFSMSLLSSGAIAYTTV